MRKTMKTMNFTPLWSGTKRLMDRSVDRGLGTAVLDGRLYGN